jgi:hypothetical protein
MAQAEPVPCGDVPFGYCHEAREPRLRGEKVIAARIENALSHLITNREQQPVGIEQEVEFRRQRY